MRRSHSVNPETCTSHQRTINTASVLSARIQIFSVCRQANFDSVGRQRQRFPTFECQQTNVQDNFSRYVNELSHSIFFTSAPTSFLVLIPKSCEDDLLCVKFLSSFTLRSSSQRHKTSLKNPFKILSREFPIARSIVSRVWGNFR